MDDVVEDQFPLTNNVSLIAAHQFPACIPSGITEYSPISSFDILGNPSADSHYTVLNKVLPICPIL